MTDLALVDSLARLALAERRAGRVFRLTEASAELRELLVLTGLDGVLLGVEPGREAEEREQRVGVQEERELDDPAL